MITVATLYAISLAWLGWCARTAPLGYQDSRGFHYGEPK